MAKGKAAAAAANTDQNASTSEAQAPAKPKKERLFQSTIAEDAGRKNEKKVMTRFNRAGRAVRGLGLTPENEKAILEILGTEYVEKAKLALSGTDVYPGPAEPEAEEMV